MGFRPWSRWTLVAGLLISLGGIAACGDSDISDPQAAERAERRERVRLQEEQKKEAERAEEQERVAKAKKEAEEKKAAEAAKAGEAATEKPVADKPVAVEKPAPVVEKPAPKPLQPVVEKPAPKPLKPVVEKPAPKPLQPVAEKPAPKPLKPVAEKPALQPLKPVAERPVPNQPSDAKLVPVPDKTAPETVVSGPEKPGTKPVADAAVDTMLPAADTVARVYVPSKKQVPLDPTCLPNALADRASKGTLGAPQIACLDESYKVVTALADRDAVSMALINNAKAKGDNTMWEFFVRRHLAEVSDDNPALVSRFAYFLFEKDPRDAAGAFRWADRALNLRAAWTGAAYTEKVYGLHKLRAAAAQELWKAAEEANIADPSADNEKIAMRYRLQMIDVSKEWMAFARLSGKDAATAVKLCTMAADEKSCGSS